MDWWTLFISGFGAFLGVAAKEWLSSFSRGSAAWEAAKDDDLADICVAIDSLRQEAENYWCKPVDARNSDVALAAQITAYQHHVGLLYGELFSGEAKRECDVAFVRFKDAVTGGDFGNPDRDLEPRRMTAVHQTALNFRHIAKRERRKLKRKMFA